MFRPRPSLPSTSKPEEASDTAAISQTASVIPLVDAVPSSTAPTEKPSALDTIKQTLSSALPGAGKGGDVQIGTLGILHPSVLTKFEIPFPISAVEFALEGL